MKKILAVFLMAIATLALAVPLSMVGARQDKDKPIPATDIELVKKVTIKGPKGKAKPTGGAATGIPGVPVTGNKYAIVIGISDYPGTGNDLLYADDDARDMKTALTLLYGYKETNIHYLVDTFATRSAIINAITDIKGKVTSNDEVVFFFSGHGAKGKADDGDTETIDEAIVAHDGTKLVPIWDGELKQWFSGFDTTRIIFIFDSCLAGGMTDLKENGRVIAMASTENGLSYESDSWGGGHGQFTYYFVDEGMIQGLADIYDHNQDGAIKQASDVTVEEAYDYAKAMCVYQTPTIIDSFKDDTLL